MSVIENNSVGKQCTQKRLQCFSEEICRKKLKKNVDDEKIEKSPKKLNQTHCIQAHQHQSPRKRLAITLNTSKSNLKCNEKKNDKFIYGNYNKYYGYRNKGKDFHDIRLDTFEAYQHLFEHREILDIGCNSGLITMELAKRFPIKHITGIDIDQNLINKAVKCVKKEKKINSEHSSPHAFPFNITFIHANYLLRDDILLQIEREQFDMILCLSVTKWIHLNFGDAGLKQSFKRMFLQLRRGGVLILEAQPFESYARRKRITDNIFGNYKAIQLFPKDFTTYLLSSEVGFTNVTLMGVPEHCNAGFKRPIQIFEKG